MIIETKIVEWFGLNGIMLFPFILVKRKPSPRLLNHERIHFAQCLELLVIPFYIIYVLEYIRHWLWFHNHIDAYKSICFEAEARAFHWNMDYLKRRRSYAWRHYIA